MGARMLSFLSPADPGHPPSPSPPETDPILLSRLLFTAGHVAQCQVVHLEVGITNELKRRRYQTEDGGPAPAVIPAQTPGTVRRGKTPRKVGGLGLFRYPVCW